ncbi:Sec-independent protein translocase subunit TatA/TatB [Mucilaginibacter antarcticus]|uniref:Sec-independent protein translocase protein TatA n=1 Tax=Mucilaginibacter antarcticus TaxID=1855725 RepID=A0ABW5XJG6_9SPHI
MLSSVLCFFEFSAPEIMLILFVTLLLFGGDKLPGLAKGLGKGIREFKDASDGVKREINNQIDNYESKQKEKAVKVDETPLIAEHSTDNADGSAIETPTISPVANTVPVSQTHVASDNVAHYDTDDEAIRNHYHGITENQEPTTNVIEEPVKKENEV